jgi:hypothetical protein
MPDPLQIHDLQTRDAAVFLPTGTVATMRRVTFWAGTHGPFTFDLDPQQATASVINSRIEDIVKELRMVQGATP